MLVNLSLGKPKIIYKIKAEEIKKENPILKVTAPTPRNLKQKIKLAEFLSPYDGKIIYPEGFNLKGFPKPYPAYENYCKKQISRFLAEAEKSTPKVAVIIPRGRIKKKFYFDLSEYVGKIVIKESAADEELQNELLTYSGTVLEYNINFNEEGPDVLKLTIPSIKEFNLHNKHLWL
ncbi:MAG: hypothetical protein U0L55_05015 [Acutalibacteraceae bacterium]|nr:hypothetical protein [Acutalibacteraceae bacterium]